MPPSQPSKPRPDSGQSRARVYRVVVQDLQDRIQRGEWLPGERLPSISQLARDLQVGTGSVREALRSLQSIGLVKILHGSGVYVTASLPTTELSSHFRVVGENQIIALAETRRILEPELAALAAERGTDPELKSIDDLAREMEAQARRGSGFAELDVEFHRKIALAARNPILSRTIEGVSNLFLESRRRVLMEPRVVDRAVRYHLLIADALRARNPAQARLLMQAHMGDMLNDVLTAEAWLRSADGDTSSSPPGKPI